MDLDNNKTGQQPDLTEEEIINAYLNQLENDTPDLWDRIEAGLDAYENNGVVSSENTNNESKVANIETINRAEQKRRKKSPIKWIPTVVSLAAVLLAAVIVIPYLAGNQRTKSDSSMIVNDAVSKDQTQSPSYDAAADSYEESDAMEGVQENYVNGVANEDTNNVTGQQHGDTNGKDNAIEDVAGSVGFDYVDEEQSISCVLKVIDETEKGYRCEIISVGENPYELSEGMEIDVACVQGMLQVSEDMTVQVEILGKEEDGYYIVLE